MCSAMKTENGSSAAGRAIAHVAGKVAAVVGLYTAPAAAQSFSNTIFFGDSNSDLGRYLYLPEIKAGPLATGAAFTTNPGPEWTVVLARNSASW